MTSSTATAAVRTPLPTFQLFVVYLVQLAEPITATVIYPFAPEFVRRTGITGGDETKTGYYAGLIVGGTFQVGAALMLPLGVSILHCRMSECFPLGTRCRCFRSAASTTFGTSGTGAVHGGIRTFEELLVSCLVSLSARYI